MTPKPTHEQYQETVLNELGFADLANAERAYQFNIRAAHQSVTSGKNFSGVVKKLIEIRSDYSKDKPDLLFYHPANPTDELELLSKPFTSVIEKLFRNNIVFNRNYPQPPRDGWTKPDELYECIDDLLRTRIICKYMDGPKFVCEALDAYCKEQNIDAKFRELSTEAGYYAWHFYFRSPVELMTNNVVTNQTMWVEIQVSTQLAEVITTLTHGLYEQRRSGESDTKSDKWKWDADSQHFRSAYIGHGLHLLEGIIQTFKDDMLSSPKNLAPDDIAEEGEK